MSSHLAVMLDHDLSHTALELPPAERLELARRLVESVVAPLPLSDAVTEGIRRIEEVAAGQVAGLTEEEYRAALGCRWPFTRNFRAISGNSKPTTAGFPWRWPAGFVTRSMERLPRSRPRGVAHTSSASG
ncbi:MAG TPA: addiction module protein [Opitutus sp.]|nr:addiction module protein [Opitutus sp.]